MSILPIITVSPSIGVTFIARALVNCTNIMNHFVGFSPYTGTYTLRGALALSGAMSHPSQRSRIHRLDPTLLAAILHPSLHSHIHRHDLVFIAAL